MRKNTRILYFSMFFLIISLQSMAHPETVPPGSIPHITVGMDKSHFAKYYPKSKARTYRQDGHEEWITFNYPLKEKSPDMVTFHFADNKLIEWKLNDRPEVIDEYLGEFASQAFKQGFPAIHTALKDVLTRMPFADFLKVTDRRRPVLFTEVFDSGTAQFANSSEIISLPDDAPAFADGLTIIKLSTGLNAAPNPKAIEGVIAHELAHRVLEHVKKGKRTCAAEREANALIKTWGFGEEYEQASQTFGQKALGQVVTCDDK